MIGLFLALLELIRQRRVRAVQDRSFAAIQLRRLTEEEVAAFGAAEADRPEYHEFDRSALVLMDDEPCVDDDPEDDAFDELDSIREAPLDELGIAPNKLGPPTNGRDPLLSYKKNESAEFIDETE